MIRRNPSGHLPVVHESAFVDPTAILCGKIIVEENVIHPDEDLARIERVTPDVSVFSESVALANIELVKGYRRIRNEF